MNNTNNFDLENEDHALSKSRISPDSDVSDEARVPNEDDAENDQNSLSGCDRKAGVSEYDSMLSMFENYAGNDTVTGVKHGYEKGDMVWGKVKSHPWWPGHIYDEAFALASVRRSKRKGLVLVAFFGDSSYGWFHPDELIPFEPHFSEKSKQIISKTFVKAVEEAVDEVNRRRGLGLACRCRNPNNFRAANVKGYFAVVVGNNETAAVYSADQIRKARDDFRPRDVVAFMRGLAVMPKRDGRADLDFLKEKASVLAYRRVVYEEFDETYAQAFRQSPMQPGVESREVLMHSVTAPPSGPMVIAETLGNKIPTKSSKKVQENRDKYLFKRRDEAIQLKSQETRQSTSFMQQAYVEVSTELADGDYIFQRRTLPVPPDQQTPSEHATEMEDEKPSVLDGSMVKSLPSVNRFSDPTRGGVSLNKKGDQLKSSSNHYQKLAVASKLIKGQDSRLKTEPQIKVNKLKRPPADLGPDRFVAGEKEKKKKKDSGVEMSSDHMKNLGSAEDLGPDRSEKKKKKKKDSGMEMNSDHIKLGPAGKGGVSGDEVSKKASKVDADPPKKDDREDDSLPNSVGKTELKLADLLGDLYSLALNPFHGRERNSPAFTSQAFLKFRSLVFQKSLALSSPNEVEPNENHDVKPGKRSDIIRSAVKDPLPSKTPKPLFRPENQTKSGQKRGPSDRQEEIAAKRLKKVNEMKSHTVGKKALGDGRDLVLARPQKPFRAEPKGKVETPRKIRELTMLVMKFPPQSMLPSENELKARLARFGPLDRSYTRILWKSFTCRVVFIYKTDAESAYRHLTENNMFGSVSVKCYTCPLVIPGPPDSETKVQREDGPVENSGGFKAQSTQSAVEIKSCLKKPTAREAVLTPGGNGGSKGAARVKFILGGGESSTGGEEPSGTRNNLNNIGFADVGNIGSSSFSATSINTTTYGADLISKNFGEKVVPQNSLSNFHSPPVSQISKAPINFRSPQVVSQIPNSQMNFHFPQATQPFSVNVSGGAHVSRPSSTKTEVAQEMLTLLTRCNDVVIDLKSSLGYVPYYSL